jgi:hypothetical protein
MWLKPLFVRTSKNAKSGLRKWLEVLPWGGGGGGGQKVLSRPSAVSFAVVQRQKTDETANFGESLTLVA